MLDPPREKTRRPLRENATAVGLTVASVQCRVARVEKLGANERSTAQIDHGRVEGVEGLGRVVGILRAGRGAE